MNNNKFFSIIFALLCGIHVQTIADLQQQSDNVTIETMLDQFLTRAHQVQKMHALTKQCYQAQVNGLVKRSPWSQLQAQVIHLILYH